MQPRQGNLSRGKNPFRDPLKRKEICSVFAMLYEVIP